jgi:hypothetical protein
LGVGREADDLGLKEKIIFAKYEEVKTGSNLAKLRPCFDKGCFADDDDDDHDHDYR